MVIDIKMLDCEIHFVQVLFFYNQHGLDVLLILKDFFSFLFLSFLPLSLMIIYNSKASLMSRKNKEMLKLWNIFLSLCVYDIPYHFTLCFFILLTYSCYVYCVFLYVFYTWYPFNNGKYFLFNMLYPLYVISWTQFHISVLFSFFET